MFEMELGAYLEYIDVFTHNIIYKSGGIDLEYMEQIFTL
jgi:hypothetical protein